MKLMEKILFPSSNNDISLELSVIIIMLRIGVMIIDRHGWW